VGIRLAQARRNRRAAATRLVDAIAALNATLAAEIERTRSLEAAADATVNALQHALSAQTGDVSAALEHVASTSALLAQHIETDRIERGALVDVVRQLVPPSPSPAALAEPARPRVLGGSMFATPPIDSDVDVVPAAPFATGTAVCCRFGDQWINGVEVVEILGLPAHPSYRLRRYQDGYVLPALFGAGDLRKATAAPDITASDTTAPETETRPGIRWTRS
jgi:hypothetical protein